MKAKEHPAGNFTKDGKRYMLTLEPGEDPQERRQIGTAAGYTWNPLPPGEKSRIARLMRPENIPYAKGATIDRVTWATTPEDQSRWVAALVALDNLRVLGAHDENTTTVQSVLGPILDQNGQPVRAMTIREFRVVMAALTQAIAGVRGGRQPAGPARG